EYDGLTRRPSNPSAPPGPKAADGAKQQGFFLAIFASNEQALSGLQLCMRFAQLDAACGPRNTEIVNLHRRAVSLFERDAARVLAEFIHRQNLLPEARHTQQRRSPIGNA